MTITLKGADRVQKRLRRIVPESEKAMRKELEQAAVMVQQDIIAAIEKPKSGNEYALVGWRLRRVRVVAGKVPIGTRRVYRAGSPGEAPSAGKGVLLKQIKVKKRHKKFSPGVKVVASPPFARLVEFGSVNTAARPFMGPSYRKNKPIIIETIRSSTRDAIKRTR